MSAWVTVQNLPVVFPQENPGSAIRLVLWVEQGFVWFKGQAQIYAKEMDVKRLEEKCVPLEKSLEARICVLSGEVSVREGVGWWWWWGGGWRTGL